MKPVSSPRKQAGCVRGWLVMGAIVVVLGIALALQSKKDHRPPPAEHSETKPNSASLRPPNPAPAAAPAAAGSAPQTNPPSATTAPGIKTVATTNALPASEMNTAIMVTVELDFGPKLPTIGEALREVERRYEPEDGQGRTFAIIDAYGGPTEQGKLHMSMHVSMEKPGVGRLIFRRTGEVLWESRIVAGTNSTLFTRKNLAILLDDGTGTHRSVTIDGSKNPSNILAAGAKEAGVRVAEFWPDGAEREMTFQYSACGCPVEVMVKRMGDKTVRTKDLPVMFPDDPSVMIVINKLMGW